MLNLRYIRASQSDISCIAAGDGALSLITIDPLRQSPCASLCSGVDGRIAMSSRHQILIYADYYSGIKALQIDGKRVVWQLKAKEVTKLRVSQDGDILIVCRNRPPEVLLVSIGTGKLIERITGVTDGFVESLAGAQAFLNLSNELLLCSNNIKTAVQWGQFAIHSGIFEAGRFYVSGTGATLASYDLKSLQTITIKSGQSFARCDPLAWSETEQKLLGVLFEPDGSNVTSLVSFNEDLSIGSVILTTSLLWEATIFCRGALLFTSKGQLYDTSNGAIIDELSSGERGLAPSG